MTSTRGTAIIILVVVSGVLAAAGTATKANGTVGIALSDDSEPPGEYATLLLSAEATNVTAYEANLTFDPSVLQVRVISGDQFPPPETTVDNGAGWVRLNQSRDSPVDYPVVAGLLVSVRESASPGTRAALEFVRSDTSITNATDGELTIARFKNATIAIAQPTDTTRSRSTDTTTTTTTGSEPPDTTTDGSTTTASTTTLSTTARSTAPSPTTAVASTTARPTAGTTEQTRTTTTITDRAGRSPNSVSPTPTAQSPIDLTVGSTTSGPTTGTTTGTASDAGPGFGVLAVVTVTALLVVTLRLGSN